MKTAKVGAALMAASATLLVAGLVYGQDATGVHKADGDDMLVQPFIVSVDDLEDMEIYSAGRDEVGEIEAVLVDGTGKPIAVATDVGGFLGMGEKDVVIGLDQLTKSG